MSAAAGHVTDAIDTGVNVGLILDPEQLNKLEKVLESDEARNLLGDPSQSLKVHDKPVVTPPVAPSPMRRSQRQVDRSFMHKMLFFQTCNWSVVTSEVEIHFSLYFKSF